MKRARWGLALAGLVLSPGTSVAATDTPVVTLTPSQEKSLDEIYFNCDHEGELGCLRQVCRGATISRQNARDVQYLYRGVSKDFPELLTPDLRACFLRAGGRFR